MVKTDGFFSLGSSRLFKIDPMITHNPPLDQTNEAFELLDEGKAFARLFTSDSPWGSNVTVMKILL